MKILLTYIFLFFALSTFAQQKNFKSTLDLAKFIDSRYKDSAQKIYETYRWVTSNIRYDGERALAMNHGNDPRAIVDVAFQRRRGVCENFAAIFTDVCRLMGFLSVTIDGITMQNGYVDKQGHSWSAVKLGGDWYLFDPTWDAGKSSNFEYFKKTGSQFISTHMSFDPLWQMQHYPANFKDFASGRFNDNRKEYFNYNDSIIQYMNEDTLSRAAGKVARMNQVGLSNSIVKTFYKIAQSDLEGERQEQQMHWYDSATKILNECVVQLNDFITYRNNGFLPSKADAEVASLLDGIEGKIKKALQYFDKVDTSKAVLIYGTGTGREQAEKLKVSYWKQREFLHKYLATSIADRKSVFYH